jgi:transposase
MTTAGMGPAMLLQGATDTTAFVAYIEQFLAPALVAGTRVVLDNLSAHTQEQGQQVIEARGCQVWFVPAY